MEETRARYAVTRGGWIALGAFAIAYGLAMLRPSNPPSWPLLVGVPLALGALYAGLVYSGIGPVGTGR